MARVDEPGGALRRSGWQFESRAVQSGDGLAIGESGYDRFLRFVCPLWLAILGVSTLILGVAPSYA